MLVLTRRPQQVICIGDDITVTVMGLDGGRVRLGVHAPKSVRIDRKEIRERKDRDPNYCSKCTPAGLGSCRCDPACNE